MPTDRRRRKEDAGISPFKDPFFRRAAIYFDDIEYQRRFEQNLIRYDLKNGAQVTKEINNSVVISGGGGGGGGGFCLWTLEGSNIVRYGGNVGVGVHPHSNDFEVLGNVLVEAVAEQPYVEIRNWSDTAYDPVLHWSLGATPVKKYTMGVDDSDSDAWLLCSGQSLSSVVTPASAVIAREYTGYVIVSDSLNYRVHTYTIAGVRVASSGTGSAGTADEKYGGAFVHICNDGTYCYMADFTNDRIVKRTLIDQAFVAKFGTAGTGNDNFDGPMGICTDGVHLYIVDQVNNRIKKHLCSDLSYVLQTSTYEDWDGSGDDKNFLLPVGICTDGNYLWITQNSGATARIIRLYASNLVGLDSIIDDGNINSCTLSEIFTHGDNLYLINSNSPDLLSTIYRYTKAMVYVEKYLLGGSAVHTKSNQSFGGDTDGTFIYMGNSLGAPADPQEVQKRYLATPSVWVSEFGAYGATVDLFNTLRSVSLSSKIVLASQIPLSGPILKAALDLTYVDAYPLLRARDGFQLMEDGTVGATDYVGLYAPAAITASYSLTFPGTRPAATGHFAVSSAGTISFGQNVGTTGSPTFVKITSLSVATGTAPITVTSTTICTNLNADAVDGYHHNQSLLAAAGPSFDHVHLTVAIGTAPLVVTSTTVVTNLNADMVDGVHFSGLYSYFPRLYVAATASPTAADDINQTPTAFLEGCLWVEQDSNTIWFCADNADGAAVWHGIDQDLRIADSPNFAGLSVGTNDVARGLLYLYGHETGGAFGGTLVCHTSADHDAAIANYGFMVKEDDLLIGPDTNVDALLLDSNDDLYITAGSLILPASEYVNFGGTLGSGGYGLRDNAGTMQFCNSGGAWTALGGGGGASAFLDLTDVTEANYTGHANQFVKVNAGETGLEFVASSVAAHDILSASHGDALASAVSRGSIIYGNSTPKWAELAVGNAGDVLTSDGTDIAWAAPGGASHAMLSVTHTDTLADTVIRGDILYGNATPKWARLAKGTSGYVLSMGADEPSWTLVPTHASRHLSGAADLIKLDDLAAPDDNTDLNFSTSLHGLVPKGTVGTNKDQWLCGDATWSYFHTHFGYKLQGRYYSGGFGSSTLTTASFSADYLGMVPFIVTKAHTYDRIGLGIAAGHTAGRYLRLGIYATDYSSGYPYPGTLILDSGAIDVTTSIFHEVVISQLLTPGLYWLAMLNSYAFTIRLVNASGNPIGYMLGAPDGASGQDGYLTVSQAYGALPNPATAGAAPGTAGDYYPNIVLRVA